jgi:hypothetical protein
MVHRRACRAQAAQQAIGQDLVVFGNQDAQGGLLGWWAAFFLIGSLAPSCPWRRLPAARAARSVFSF